VHCLASVALAAVLAVAGFPQAGPSFPGTFVRRILVVAGADERACLSLGDDMFDKDVGEIGVCRGLGIHTAGNAGSVSWVTACTNDDGASRPWIQSSRGRSFCSGSHLVETLPA